MFLAGSMSRERDGRADKSTWSSLLGYQLLWEVFLWMVASSRVIYSVMVGRGDALPTMLPLH